MQMDQSKEVLSLNHCVFRFSTALKQLIAATNPYSDTKEADANNTESGETDCCICIGHITPYQALFIAPCSHVYHFKCVGYLVMQSPMFQCPLCRQVANLTASVSCYSLNESAQLSDKIVPSLPILGIFNFKTLTYS